MSIRIFLSIRSDVKPLSTQRIIIWGEQSSLKMLSQISWVLYGQRRNSVDELCIAQLSTRYRDLWCIVIDLKSKENKK